MTSGIELFLTLFNNLAISIALVTFYNCLIRRFDKLFWVQRQILTGLLFGVFAIGCMYSGISISEGVVVDQRNAIIILSGAFGGPVSAIISAVLSGSFRLYLGGSGAFAGVVGVTLSAMAGIVLYRYQKNFESIKIASVSSFFATLAILPGFLLVEDFQTGWGLFKTMALPYGAANYLGICLIGLMLKKQEHSFSIEKSFQKSQERLELALKGANDSHWDWDLKTGTVYFSPRCKEILGYTDQEFVNTVDSWMNNVCPEDLAPARAALKKITDGQEEHLEHEFRMRHKDGSWRWILGRGTGVKACDGSVCRVAGTQTDITERKWAQTKLAESEKQHRLLTEHAVAGIAVLEILFDSSGRPVDYVIISANPAAETHSGLKRADVLGRRASQVLPGIGDKAFLKRFGQVVLSGEPASFERFSEPLGRFLQACVYKVDGNRIATVFTDISEHKRQEKELRESELRFQTVIDASPVPFILENNSGKIIYMNPAFTDTFGYTLDDIPHVDDWWSTVYPDPEYREEVKNNVYKQLEKAEQSRLPLPPMEVRICCKDGSFRRVSVSIATLGRSCEKIQLGILFDVTLISHISERLQTILANTSDGMHVLDAQGNLVEFSKSFSHMLGYTAEETRQLHSNDWGQSGILESIPSIIQKSMGAPTTFETRHRRKNGEMVDVEITAKGIVLDGQPMLYASSRDITVRKRAEAQLKQALLEQSAILENANVGIVLVKDRIQVKCNKKMSEIFGYELEEMINKSTRMFYSSQKQYEEAVRRIRPVIFGGGVYTTERKLTRKDGSPVWVQASGTAIDADSAQSGSIWVLEDISEAKAREQELQKAKGQAEQASKLKSEFLANMSHEIRTPMNGVIGMADLILDTPLSTEQWHYANAIRSSGKLLLGLINDILDFSKIEAGKLEVEIIDFDLLNLLDDFMDSMAARAHEKNLELLCSVAQGTPICLKGDPGRLRQVLNNLAGNAIKFTETGEILIKVSVLKDNENECLIRFVVRDTGIGIPGDKLALLFDKFSQVDTSTTRRYGGTGLGLAIAKQLVELMDGEIGVSSHEGNGSSFFFTARLEKQDIEQPGLLPVPEELQGTRILVVDDNATSRKILTNQLSAWGMRPGQSPDGHRALAELRNAFDAGDPCRIAVINMQMPDMDGETLVRTIKDDSKLVQTRIVMLTTPGNRYDARRIGKMDLHACVNKPIRLRNFLFTLIKVISDGSANAPQGLVNGHVAREKMLLFNPDARVLVVEDNDINRQVAVGSLMNLGLHADAVTDGVEALEALKHTPYDLVFMDLQMPGMDGYQAIERIRDTETGVLNSDVPVIAMTAHAMLGDREKCLSSGMNDYISKPIDKKNLLKVLKKRLPTFTAPSSSAVPAKASPAENDLPELAGIAVQEALKSLDMDFESYKAYLLTFQEDAKNALDALPELVVCNLSADLCALAHKFSGAAANLHAFQVKNAAVALEKVTRQGEISAVLVDEFKKALEIYIDAVKSLEKAERMNETENIDLDTAYQYMEKIEALIASSDFVEEALVLGLKQALSGSVDQFILNRLKNSLQDFDYQGSEEALKLLRARLDSRYPDLRHDREKGI